ncbi:MAG: MMPL family transporter [Acidimicrobiales bacterium]
MLARLGGFVVRRRRLVLVSAVLAFAISGAVGGGVADRLSSGGFNDPNAESSHIEPILEDQFQSGTPNVILLVTARNGSIDDPAVAAAGVALAGELAAETYDGLAMTQVVSYWDLGPGNPLGSEDGDRALVLARFPDEDDNLLVEFSRDLTDQYTRDDPSQPISVRPGGQGPLFAEVNETIESDLLRAEIIALPITLFLLLLVFGSVVSATLPILVGVLSIVGTFLVLLIINTFTEVSVFSLNLTTAMGLGLAIDYSLFIVSRYREELHRGFEPNDAVLRTVQTAGRTVLFSSLTVAASMAALLVFDIAFLRSFAYAGCAVAVLAGLYATVVLPAVLAALGHRVNALTIRKRAVVPPEEGFWHRMASFVMRRPIGITAAVLVLLALLGSPFLGIQLGVPDDRVLPDSKETRQVSDIIRAEFASQEAGAVSIVATGIGSPEQRSADVAAYAQRLAAIEGVTRVDTETGIYCGSTGAVGGFPCEPGTPLPLPPEQGAALADRFNRPDATFLSVVPDVEPISDEGEQLVDDIRDAEAPFGVLAGGPSAVLVDSNESMAKDLPLALGIIAVVTSVLLFLMFGSVVIPAKAFVLNILSLSATFGAMVWVFQDGHLAGFLNFTPTGTLASSTLVVMFCVAFGLSMDFEVFLLSRVKEQHDNGADNVTSVAIGLEQTGRIVTAAAVLISVVFVAFAVTGEVSFMKLFGIGLTVAVLLDAFVIRGTLVPAFMRLAGNANWWAPGFLRRVHDRVGFSEHVDLDAEAARLEAADDEQPEPVGT